MTNCFVCKDYVRKGSSNGHIQPRRDCDVALSMKDTW